MKTCQGCQRVQDLDNFPKLSIGHHSFCEDCIEQAKVDRLPMTDIADKKRCSVCEKTKTKEHFQLSKNSSDGLHNMCRDCWDFMWKAIRVERIARRWHTNQSKWPDFE